MKQSTLIYSYLRPRPRLLIISLHDIVAGNPIYFFRIYPRAEELLPRRRHALARCRERDKFRD